MATDFEREKFIASLATAMAGKEQAARLGAELARKGVRRLILVGCGAPNRCMNVLKYWVEKAAANLDVRLYYPAEFVNQAPPVLGPETLVVLGSHSGTTPETVLAAEILREMPCTTVGLCQNGDSPLARAVDYPLPYGPTENGYYATYILLQAFVAGLLKEAENWPLYDQVMESLTHFPAALTDAVEANEARVTDEARIYKDDRFMYVIGSGPMFSTAYVTGVCYLMEMQWMHGAPLEAAEFFHGPFEVVDQNTPLILLLGEDPSRPEAERVVRFCKKYTERLMIYDSRAMAMPGVHADVRAIFAPFIVQAVITRMVQHLAVWHAQPLSTRRYMWKTEY